MPDQSPDQSPDQFSDVLAANADYARTFALRGLEPVAGRGLAVVTCMDSRIEPLDMLGLKPGDAKIMRNAGARVTSDVLRTLALATHLLGVTRVMVVAHTKCKMASATREEVVSTIEAQSGIDVRSLDFRLVADQEATLRDDVQRVRSWPFLPAGVPVGGFRYDVDTGRLEHLV
ncbi:carbonic anhydrase [Haloactinopolyspora alba]|uniref:carbonic anhydrase n=1 Tax=Haloactinopolyspora alba TaxID=648780 RepID=A0A2P8E2J1_9ACTN|nr:carbonic anhydrase [Haloactinopolyspora alba]PSL03685.1 carbonic anhydrase [Haloactinopolyspora alba]